MNRVLAADAGAFYYLLMKALFFIALMLVVLDPIPSRGQDPAVEEKLNKLAGQVEDLFASQAAQSKRIEELINEIRELRVQLDKPNPDYASQEDLKRLADTVREVDQKRLNDYEKIRTEIQALAKSLSASITPPTPLVPDLANPSTNANQIPIPEGHFEYIIQTNDALSKIAQTYRREKNIKVTVDDILKANPGLSANRIRAGQKIIIPANPQEKQASSP